MKEKEHKEPTPEFKKMLEDLFNEEEMKKRVNEVDTIMMGGRNVGKTLRFEALKRLNLFENEREFMEQAEDYRYWKIEFSLQELRDMNFPKILERMKEAGIDLNGVVEQLENPFTGGIVIRQFSAIKKEFNERYYWKQVENTLGNCELCKVNKATEELKIHEKKHEVCQMCKDWSIPKGMIE